MKAERGAEESSGVRAVAGAGAGASRGECGQRARRWVREARVRAMQRLQCLQPK